jgi:hypothetical protein
VKKVMTGKTVHRATDVAYGGGKILGRLLMGASLIGLGGVACGLAGVGVGGYEVAVECIPDKWKQGMLAAEDEEPEWDGEQAAGYLAAETEVVPEGSVAVPQQRGRPKVVLARANEVPT